MNIKIIFVLPELNKDFFFLLFLWASLTKAFWSMDFRFYAKQVFPVLAMYTLPTTSRNTPISNVLMWPEDETGGFPGNITNIGSVVNITSIRM